MKISFNRASMASACKLASKALSTKDIKPILSHILLRVADDSAVLLATDLETGLRVNVGVKVEVPGDVTMSPAMVKAIAECADEEMTLSLNDKGDAKLKGSRSSHTFATIDVKEFPNVPEFDADTYHEIDISELDTLISRTTFLPAVHTRFTAMSGVLVECDESNLRLVSSDGSCMSVVEASAKQCGEHKASAVVPVKFLTIAKSLAEEGTAKVCVRQNDALIQCPDATLYTRLIDGRFPAFRNFIPKNPKPVASLVAGQTLQAIKQASVTLSAESWRLMFDFENGKATLGAKCAELGESSVEMPVACERTMKASYRPVNLADMLSRLAPDTVVQMAADGHDKPAVFTVDRWQYIVVPLVETKAA